MYKVTVVLTLCRKMLKNYNTVCKQLPGFLCRYFKPLKMDKFTMEIEREGKRFEFAIADLMHHSEKCKFEVYSSGEFVASFEPDGQGFLHLCKNTGKVDREFLYLIADKIEIYNLV